MSYDKCGIVGCRKKYVCHTIVKVLGYDTVIKLCDKPVVEHKSTKEMVEEEQTWARCEK